MNTATLLTEKSSINQVSRQAFHSDNQPLMIKQLIQHVMHCVPPVWPLETFIACNPLHGFENQPFDVALSQADFQQKQIKHHPSLEQINRHMIKWCSAFFDEGQSRIAMPNREQGLYACFLTLVRFDHTLHQNKKSKKDFLRQLPSSSEAAIQQCLTQLKIPHGQEQTFVTHILRDLPGWAGYVKWKAEWQSSTNAQNHTLLFSDFIAIRLILTCLLWPDAANIQRQYTNDALKHRTWINNTITQMKQHEDVYRQNLLCSLRSTIKETSNDHTRKNAQLVFCIDVRSEPLRRAIESLGHYETFGFAGFFGLPVSIHELDKNKHKDCCPVLLKPKFIAFETPVSQPEAVVKQYQRKKSLLSTIQNAYTQLKQNVSTPFAFVESLGLWYGLGMILKSLSPYFFAKIMNQFKSDLPTIITCESDAFDLEQRLSLSDQIHYAESVLRLMGLTSGFAKLIIFCGHGGQTENNPYASALDCGACGGNHGGHNARLLASILNNPKVRHGLEDCGMHIPLDTVFYGALHNTTTDSVELYFQDNQTTVYPDLIKQLKHDLQKARILTNHERSEKLCNAHQDIKNRSLDWSETRPEWGLAQNAAFIVGPRHITKHTSLDGRCFLHSYRFEHDQDGTLLETILTAPMVVAEWINTQYLFSTLDNIAFGSGSKMTHNIVGTIGVMQGNGSDLMHGLPLQSVMRSDYDPYHCPQRLLSIVYAPKALVSRIIDRQPILQTLFLNEWVHLCVIDPHDHQTYRLTKSGTWTLEPNLESADIEVK